MVTSTYLPSIGGIEYHIEGLAKTLTNNEKYHVDIAIVSKEYENFSYTSDGSIGIFRIPATGKFPFLFFKNLKRYIDTLDYDMLHIHDPQVAGISLHFIFNKYNTPTILSTHGGMFHTQTESFIKKIYWHIFTRNILKNYKKIVAVSKNDFHIFNKIISDDKIILIENGINYKKFNNKGNLTRDYRKLEFLYFGRFSSNKQVHVLIDIFIEFSKKKSNVELLLIGGTDNKHYLSLLKNKILKNKQIKIINFLEYQSLIKKMKEFNFFITASNYEGFGMSILEAMSAGLIPVVNNISPLNSLVNDGINGIVIEFNNHNKAVKQLEEVYSINKVEFFKLQKEALSKAYTFSWETISKKYEVLYESLQPNDM